MTALRSRVIVQETRAIAPFYDKFLSAQKNGRKSISAFWGQFRYRIKTGELDPHLERAFRQLNVHGFQAHSATGLPLRIDFSYNDAVVIKKCSLFGKHYSLCKADTIKLLLIASDILDGGQTFVESLIHAPVTNVSPNGADNAKSPPTPDRSA